MNSSSVFNVDQLNTIRDTHQEWCAENSVDPKSPLGEEAAAFLIKAFDVEHDNVDSLIAALDHHVLERGRHVKVGSTSIPSTQRSQ
ncbi:hypothetical protein [Aliirhizobium cellulosilyticum]|uniref:Uncharacterized protein n=1 Tax=Aliirhizobium cellulosilyticum TaxID=393664 RepID=A0A7W6SEX5_9HYPH|nr:hypothetical protein [Rhizobium cellulosilyticum]MBB4351837.1 hypothetical protein [Rhizobium cellulosilyticum]MBB4415071.1 hypothetical protein [Rhizobium cellulosilyticum]MBB4449763.1 hypothetical protein [Rhizobium cellulosilyticum]